MTKKTKERRKKRRKKKSKVCLKNSRMLRMKSVVSPLKYLLDLLSTKCAKKPVFMNDNGEFISVAIYEGRVLWMENIYGANFDRLYILANWPYAKVREDTLSDDDLKYTLNALSYDDMIGFAEKIRSNIPKDDREFLNIVPKDFKDALEKALSEGYKAFEGETSLGSLLNLIEGSFIYGGDRVAFVYLPFNSLLFISSGGNFKGLSFPGGVEVSKRFFMENPEVVVRSKVISVSSL